MQLILKTMLKWSLLDVKTAVYNKSFIVLLEICTYTPSNYFFLTDINNIIDILSKYVTQVKLRKIRNPDLAESALK